MATHAPSRKRSRASMPGQDSHDRENGPQFFDLCALYEGDLGEKILSYASGSDLCTLEMLCRSFRNLSKDAQWRYVTQEKFGMKNGKEDWKIGNAFLREPVFMHTTDDGDHGYGNPYYHKGTAATNGSIIVAVGDDVDNGVNEWTYPRESNGIGIRDAFSLNYFRTVPSPFSNFNAAICGPLGSEIIVTANAYRVAARRGNVLQSWAYMPANDKGIPMIGCETHLIVAPLNIIDVFQVNSVEAGENDNKLVSRAQQVVTFSDRRDHNIQTISWGPDNSSFVVCHPSQITIWKFDPQSSNISQNQTIAVSDHCLKNVALAYDFIAASSHDKKLHIWNRNTGEKLHHDLCDVDDYDADADDDEPPDFEMYYPLSMSCFGHILVTTSYIGCALCVWNMKTGTMLKRYNHAEDEGPVDMLPDGGFDATSMVYLEPLNAFLCMSCGAMNIWAFPTNARQILMAKSIRRRERLLRLALHSGDYQW